MDLSFISEFVRGTSRLILPDLGAFLVKDFESGFDLKNVTFSTFLRYQDSTFTTLLAAKFGIPFQEAGEKAKAIIAHIAQELKNNRRCALPGLGALSVLNDGQIAFQPGETNAAVEAAKSEAKENLSAEAAPLIASTASSTPQKQPAPAEKAGATPPSTTQNLDKKTNSTSAVTPQKRPVAAQRKPGQRPKYVKRESIKKNAPKKNEKRSTNAPAQKSEKSGSNIGKILLFCLLAITILFAIDFLWLGLVTPRVFPEKAPYFAKRSQKDATTPATEKVAAVAPLTDSTLAQTQEASESKTDFTEEFSRRTGDQDSITNGNISAQNQASENQAKVPTTAPTSYHYSAPSGVNSYHLIVGSFEIESNATRFSAQLKKEGLASSVLNQPSGMHAVTIGSFSSLAAAKAELQEMKQRYPDVWILHL